jgi:hypothetical protein
MVTECLRFAVYLAAFDPCARTSGTLHLYALLHAHQHLHLHQHRSLQCNNARTQRRMHRSDRCAAAVAAHAVWSTLDEAPAST